jgi:hypothetical protein
MEYICDKIIFLIEFEKIAYFKTRVVSGILG